MKTLTTKKLLIAFLLFTLHSSFFTLFSQNIAINNTGAPPNPSALVDMASTNGGLLIPRMTTTQMNAIPTPAAGLLLYNTTTNCLMMFTGGSWQVISCACVTPPTTPGTITGNASPCFGSSGITYSIAALVGAGSYTWTVPAGDTITSGQGTPYISVKFGKGSGAITVTASNSCGASTAQSTSVTVDTSALAYFTPLSAPVNNSVTFSPSIIGTAYSWAFQNGSPSASSSQNPSVTWSSTGTYTVSLTVTSASGCSSTTVKSVTISSHGQVFGYTGSINSFTVPSGVSTITIQAWGAQGGGISTEQGGFGAYMSGTFAVSPGNVMQIMVGQAGGAPINNGWGGGGGGGTFATLGSSFSSGTLLIVAGGGGGSGCETSGSSINGLTTTAASNGYYAGSSATPGTGGTGGSGGSGGTFSANGGGFSTNGTSSPVGGTACKNGGAGGSAASSGNDGNGGFGGGAGGGGTSNGDTGGGGGGGYSGGGGGGCCCNAGGGGGGSYNIGNNQNNISGVQTGNGQIIITW